VDNGLRIGGDVAGRIAAIEVDGALCIFEDAGQAQGGIGKRFGIGQRDAPVFKLLLSAGKLFFSSGRFPLRLRRVVAAAASGQACLNRGCRRLGKRQKGGKSPWPSWQTWLPAWLPAFNSQSVHNP
jgi:hypothetical protein